jgi:hypothetical protein
MIFTNKKIIWEYCEKSPYIPTAGRGAGIILIPFVVIRHYIKRNRVVQESFGDINEKKDIDEILKNLKSFELEYMSIEKIKIKKGSLKLVLIRRYPILGKKTKIRFFTQFQYDIESIFMRMLPSKTMLKKY